jgi:hypothetical protein
MLDYFKFKTDKLYTSLIITALKDICGGDDDDDDDNNDNNTNFTMFTIKMHAIRHSESTRFRSYDHLHMSPSY